VRREVLGVSLGSQTRATADLVEASAHRAEGGLQEANHFNFL
jgi:hypothetical protein